MENIFDQYTQPEYRLTHALVSVLYQDKLPAGVEPAQLVEINNKNLKIQAQTGLKAPFFRKNSKQLKDCWAQSKTIERAKRI